MTDIPPHGVPSKAAIGRHPIHPMLIPFPIAFLTGALATDLVALGAADPFWARASYWLLLAGLVSGLAAGAVGAVDYVGVDRVRAHKAGHLHALGNVTALALAFVNLLLRDGGAEVSALGIALSAVVAGLLGVTGWLGGELSYRYKVGVMEPAGPEGRRGSSA